MSLCTAQMFQVGWHNGRADRSTVVGSVALGVVQIVPSSTSWDFSSDMLYEWSSMAVEYRWRNAATPR